MTCCKKSIGLLIIRLGLWWLLLMWGISKIMSATPEMMNMVGGAAHNMWLTFLSTNVWFWLAAIWETLAWATFLLGIFLPLWSILAVIIMAVAFAGAHNANMQEGMPAIFLWVVALGMWFAGPGKYSLKNLLCKKCEEWNFNTNKVEQNTPTEIVNA